MKIIHWEKKGIDDDVADDSTTLKSTIVVQIIDILVIIVVTVQQSFSSDNFNPHENQITASVFGYQEQTFGQVKDRQ